MGCIKFLHLLLFLALFSSKAAWAQNCQGYLGATQSAFVSLNASQSLMLLTRFGILKPQLINNLDGEYKSLEVIGFDKQVKYIQVNHLTRYNMGLYTLRSLYTKRMFEPKILDVTLEAHEKALTFFLSYAYKARRPISVETLTHIEEVAKVHLEIKSRYAVAKNKSNPRGSLSREKLLLLRYIVDHSSILKKSLDHLSLDTL